MTPSVHDTFGRPLTQEDVDRRAKALTVGKYEDDTERLVRAFTRWRTRATLTFCALAVVASIAVYLAYDAGHKSTVGLKRNAYDAAVANCIGGAELRLAVADGLDSLRRLAISGYNYIPKNIYDLFILQTQPPIDKLLSQAVGGEFHAPLPPGIVTDKVKADVKAAAMTRCRRRSAEQFGRSS